MSVTLHDFGARVLTQGSCFNKDERSNNARVGLSVPRKRRLVEHASFGMNADWMLGSQVIVLGDGAVGKTSIANRFTEDSFSKRYRCLLWRF